MTMSDHDKVSVYKWIIGGYVALRIAKLTAAVILYRSYNEGEVVGSSLEQTTELFDELTTKKASS
jgi:hypothetical protein